MPAKSFDLDPSYKQVPERIADFRAKHPDGSLEPADRDRPFWVETIDGATFIVYVAAAYRTPTDTRPGIGMAWEPFPGLTPFTRNSELQNAETSAWGRAIIAALASESKSIASAEDVRNRRAEEGVERPPQEAPKISEAQVGFITGMLRDLDVPTLETDADARWAYVTQAAGREEMVDSLEDLSGGKGGEASRVITVLKERLKAGEVYQWPAK